MRHHLFLCSGILLVSLLQCNGCCVQAQPASPIPGKTNPKVTLDLENVTLREALTLLFRQAGVSYRLSPDMSRLADQERRSAHLHGVTFEEALHQLVDSVPNVAIQVKSGVYTFLTHLSLSMHDAEPLTVLQELFRRLHASFICTMDSLGTSKITLSVIDGSPEQIFDVILREMHSRTRLTLTCVAGVYVVRPEQSHLDFEAAYAQTVFIDLKEAPFRAAVRALFFAADLNYVLTDSIEGGIVWEGDKPFRIALEDVLHAYSSRYRSKPEEVLTHIIQYHIFNILNSGQSMYVR